MTPGWGAVPFQRAKDAFDRNSAAPAVSPTILAADSTPQPGQRRRQSPHDRPDLDLELVGSNGELPAAGYELAGDGRHSALQARQPTLDIIEDVEPTESLRRDHPPGEQLVEVPAQPALDARTLPDQVFSVVAVPLKKKRLPVDCAKGRPGSRSAARTKPGVLA